MPATKSEIRKKEKKEERAFEDKYKRVVSVKYK